MTASVPVDALFPGGSSVTSCIGWIKRVGVLEKNVLKLQKYIFEKFKSSNETFGHFYGR